MNNKIQLYKVQTSKSGVIGEPYYVVSYSEDEAIGVLQDDDTIDQNLDLEVLWSSDVILDQKILCN